jgi:acetyl-CoA carboxylase biotin carboxyl carrier protein
MKKKQPIQSSKTESFELKEIQELIQMLSKTNIAEVSIERGNYKLTLRTHDPNAGTNYIRHEMPVQSIAPSAPHFSHHEAHRPKEVAPPKMESEPESASESKLITIKSPMIGTFYRSATPEKPSFVNVGDEIKEGQVLCIIEAMKLFNEIESEHQGRIVKILVDNASPVEYDQPLFLIEPI